MTMRVLVTAGCTQVPIDRVRAITNVFTGRTGTQVAAAIAALPDTSVRLLTSAAPRAREWGLPAAVEVQEYTTFDELAALMQRSVQTECWPSAIVHSAAVSDYLVESVAGDGGASVRSDGKIDSSNERLVVTLTKAPKLVDRVRTPWGFDGALIKFKLTVGQTDAALESIARASMLHSHADAIVANDLAWAADRAMLIEGARPAEHVERAGLATRVAMCVRDLVAVRAARAGSTT